MNNSKGKLVNAMIRADKVAQPVCKYGLFVCAAVAVASVLAPEKVAIVKALLSLGGS